MRSTSQSHTCDSSSLLPAIRSRCRSSSSSTSSIKSSRPPVGRCRCFSALHPPQQQTVQPIAAAEATAAEVLEQQVPHLLLQQGTAQRQWWPKLVSLPRLRLLLRHEQATPRVRCSLRAKRET
ncbi:hypothetical protein ACSSS7_005691 [Eimeria intestinalis]